MLVQRKFAGTPGTPDNMDELIDMGYRFISIGADVVGLSEYCKNLVTEFKKHFPGNKSIRGEGLNA